MVRHRLKLRLLPLLAALMLAASSPVMPGPSAVHRVQPVDIRLLRPGDLIFRSGRGHRAEMVRLFSQDRLTHVGIIDVGATEAFVIHAAPPEGDFPGGVIREPLDHFIAADQAYAVRIYRRRGVTGLQANRLIEVARSYAQRHIPFDDSFDLEDGRAFYCTEMVWRASQAAGVLIPVRTTIIGGPFGGRYMMPHDLLHAAPFALVAAP